MSIGINANAKPRQIDHVKALKTWSMHAALAIVARG
jgi:hypothetical protein